MNERLEIKILQAKVSALTELVNELAMTMCGRADVGDAFRKSVSDLMGKCQHAGQDHIEFFERMQEP